MGTGTHAAEGKSWKEVTIVEINPGTPGASPPPPGPQATRSLLPFPKMWKFPSLVPHHQKSHQQNPALVGS